MEEFCIVKFTKDDSYDILPLTSIKKFDVLKHKAKPSVKYMVKWKDGREYEGCVTHISKKAAELEQMMADNNYASFTDEEYDKREKILKSKAPKSLNKVNDVHNKFLESILLKNKEKDEQKKSSKSTVTLHAKCQEEIEELQQENFTLKEKLEKQLVENEKLKSLNRDLQMIVIDHFRSLSTSAEMPDMTNISDISNMPIGKKCGKKVHLGQGVTIDAHVYDSILAYQKGPQSFVKLVAEAVFGTAMLSRSSVTGKPCKSISGSSAKPALDPQKLVAIQDIFRHWMVSIGTAEVVADLEVRNIGLWISRKITELNRVRKPKVSKCQAEPNAEENINNIVTINDANAVSEDEGEEEEETD